jgi:hypothetical protein
MKSGYYINKQNQLVVVTPNKTISVWSEQDSKWISFIIVKASSLDFDWEYLGGL